MMNKVEIDATNETLGRLSSKIALLLRGKNLPTYEPSELPKNEVVLKNIDKIRFTGLKLENKRYYHYSGYHSGLKTKKLSDLWKDKPQNVIRHTVYRMLPKNKTRDKIIKNLKFAK